MYTLFSLGLLLLSASQDPVEKALEARPDFLRHHAGYLQAVAAYPQLAEAEQAWWKSMRDPAYRRLEQDFEIALAQTPALSEKFMQFYADLPADGTVAAENLIKKLNAGGDGMPLLGTALEYLQRDPQGALKLLQGVSALGETGGEIGAILGPLQQYVQEHPDAAEGLRTLFSALVATPAAQERSGPWASVVSGLNSTEQSPYQALLQHFVSHPAQFWTWHQRNLALAQTPELAQWIRWWHLRVQAEPELRERYVPWLSQRAAQESLSIFAGGYDFSAWPPAGRVPALPPLPSPHAQEAPADSGAKASIAKPEKPGIQRPPKPSKPDRPARPGIPEMRQSTRVRERN